MGGRSTSTKFCTLLASSLYLSYQAARRWRQTGPAHHWHGARKPPLVRPSPTIPGPRRAAAAPLVAVQYSRPRQRRLPDRRPFLGSAKSVSAGALIKDEPGRPRRISAIRWRTLSMLIPEAATWSWLGKAYPLAVVSGSSSAAVKQERVVWTLTVNSTSCSIVRGLFLRPMTSANARARLSVSSALASQPWLWCQSSQHTSEWRLVWRAGSPVKTRERGTKTSSSQTIESSSSNRLLKGDRNGFSCLTDRSA